MMNYVLEHRAVHILEILLAKFIDITRTLSSYEKVKTLNMLDKINLNLHVSENA